MVYYGANTVSALAGDFHTVFDGARQSLRPAGNLQQTPRHSATLPDSLSDRRGTCRRLPESLRRCQDRKNTYRRFPDCLRMCQTVFQTDRAYARDSHTFYDVPKLSGQLQETPKQSLTVPDSLSLRRKQFGNLLQVPRQSLHRRRLSESLLQVPLRFGRLSYTVWESPAGVRTVLAPSQTVLESPAGAQLVWETF
ncbi:hypothetical protein DPMN_139252 [Dreissena polymorpha]|uniref:Uncharacterized protein n=1 Tax=Dreissena polymorpha TaxID=45954 RepID=A0A9D4G877_DREPO|nr:hypothetical protein DPMN_139252 [Dreissena polymorpha]